MKLLRKILYIVFLVGVIALTFGVAYAETYKNQMPKPPIKVKTYDYFWSGTDGFFDQHADYGYQFSPYSTSTVHVSGYIHLGYEITYKIGSAGMYSDVERQYIADYYRRYFKSPTVEVSPRSEDGLISFDYRLEDNGVACTVYDQGDLVLMGFVFEILIWVDLEARAGNFMLDSQGVSTDNTILKYSFETIPLTLAFLQVPGKYISVDPQPYRIYAKPRTICDLHYRFAEPVTTDRIVFNYETYVEYFENDDMQNNDAMNGITLTAFLNGYDLGRVVKNGAIGKIYECQFDYDLRTTDFNIRMVTDGFPSVDISGMKSGQLIKFCGSIGRITPFTLNSYSGGGNYGDWASRSCKMWDIPCHLGNALGYFMYEFPLTAPIVKLVLPLGDMLNETFNFLTQFSEIGILYQVVISMIVLSIIFVILVK